MPTTEVFVAFVYVYVYFVMNACLFVAKIIQSTSSMILVVSVGVGARLFVAFCYAMINGSIDSVICDIISKGGGKEPFIYSMHMDLKKGLVVAFGVWSLVGKESS